ncbi:hypothetical protein BDF19DRAFT_433068 [Syncephalis fuscata]|nr:hypothetical protein BDF19DRAFT_433068 [Syncephalis fuscata]
MMTPRDSNVNTPMNISLLPPEGATPTFSAPATPIPPNTHSMEVDSPAPSAIAATTTTTVETVATAAMVEIPEIATEPKQPIASVVETTTEAMEVTSVITETPSIVPVAIETADVTLSLPVAIESPKVSTPEVIAPAAVSASTIPVPIPDASPLASPDPIMSTTEKVDHTFDNTISLPPTDTAIIDPTANIIDDAITTSIDNQINSFMNASANIAANIEHNTNTMVNTDTSVDTLVDFNTEQAIQSTATLLSPTDESTMIVDSMETVTEVTEKTMSSTNAPPSDISTSTTMPSI